MLSSHLFSSEPLTAGHTSSMAPKQGERYSNGSSNMTPVFSDALEKATEQPKVVDADTSSEALSATDEEKNTAELVVDSNTLGAAGELQDSDFEDNDQQGDELFVAENSHSLSPLTNDGSAIPEGELLSDVSVESAPISPATHQNDVVEIAAVSTERRKADSASAPDSIEVLSTKSNQQVMSDGEALLQRLTAANRQLTSTSSLAGVNPETDGNSLPLDGSVASEGTDTNTATSRPNNNAFAQLFNPSNQSEGTELDQAEIQSDLGAENKQPDVAARLVADSGALKVANGALPLDKQMRIDMSNVFPDDMATTPATSGVIGQQLQGTQPIATSVSVFGPESTTLNAVGNHIQGLMPDTAASLSASADGIATSEVIPNKITAEMLSSTLLGDGTQQADGGAGDSAAVGATATTSSSSPLHSLQAKMNEAALATNQPPLQLNREQAGDELADRMQMMMSKNLKHVDIRLDPPELGRLQIKLTINNDQASVQFTVANQQTRDLVEHAMPRLRELLQQQGVQLAQTSVQQDSSRQFSEQSQQQNEQGGEPSGRRQSQSADQAQELADFHGVQPMDIWLNPAKNGVDYYA